MINNKIIIKNAQENNLKNVDLELPKNKLIVITGVSGSGKSSIAFDVLYNEGRRRYVDSLSNYARQFLGGTAKPAVDSIEGLSPAIAIDQKTTSNNPRSTVGTITEIYDFYRLLFARIGIPYCPIHNIEISSQTITQIINQIYNWKENSKLQIFAPLVSNKKGSFKNEISELKKEGFLRIRVNKEILHLDNIEELDKHKKYTIDILVDRIILNTENRSRIYESLGLATKYADGLVSVENLTEKKEELYSLKLGCKHGDFSMPKIEPKLFSFNSPLGACNKCNGLGFIQQVTWEKMVDQDKTILEGGIKYFGDKLSGYNWEKFIVLLKEYNILLDKKLKDFTEKEQEIILYGSKEPINFKVKTKSLTVRKYDYIEGLATMIERLNLETASDFARNYYKQFFATSTCDKCNGSRLNQHALAVKINHKNIFEVTALSIEEANKWIKDLKLSEQELKIVNLVISEIKSRFKFLINVGLGYLTLNRMANTLSGGESQRIRLASQLGSKLTGVIYVLDEPSIGLHQRDNEKLINTLKEIRDLGNTVVVVEHDEEMMLESDYLIDIGPDAGIYGGKVIATGTAEEVAKKETHTGNFLSGKDQIEIPKKRRNISEQKYLEIYGAKANNLKNINVKIPLKKFVVVSGVSGSGKSTLVNEIIYKKLHNLTSHGNHFDIPGLCDAIKGVENIDKVVRISQDPIGKTPRSNPVTYTSVFSDIRELFASTNEAKIKGYAAGRFSFNVKGGRCEKCQGDGILRIPMHFLPDVYVKCDECNGKRYNEETLQITFKDKNIADVLDMSVEEANIFFKNQPKISRKLKYLKDVGLDYIKLGHSSTLLSGGEAQRVKLATYLQKKATGKTLYILDEPTTGLHHHDIKKLLVVLNKIVDNGDSILIIEHNLDVIKVADHIIDMGPEGGNHGGKVIAHGTPEEISNSKISETGKYLKYILK